MKNLLKVSLRQQAVFIPASAIISQDARLKEQAALLVSHLSKSGYTVSESLLKALNNTAPAVLASIKNVMQGTLGLKKNWTPLVRGWDQPTGENVVDHLRTFLTSAFQLTGTRLPCGHIIPPNSFPLERYNGCPYCGTAFEFGRLELLKQGSHIKVLELWSEADINNYLRDLLTSHTALDATQMDSLKLLLESLPLPEVEIKMKETVMAVIDVMISQGKDVQALMSSPVDILRYLWYKHTGFLQIVEPKTIVNKQTKNNKHIRPMLDTSASAKLLSRAALKLKYNRKQCLMVATWMNKLEMEPAKICELMHAKRGMWIRLIRALRLAEYSKRSGFDKLKTVLDKFYNEDYEVWQGKIEQFRLRYDVNETTRLLKQRPGMFARSLFANMLWFGSDIVIDAFKEVIDKVPARLVFTLDMYAANYFDRQATRVVKTLGGSSKKLPANGLVQLYSDEQLKEMKAEISGLCIEAMKLRFAAIETTNKTMYIDPVLFKLPVSIGDRSDNVQDVSAVLMGTRFIVDGETVRLFMQWGNGLPAQHLDMDLSCHVAYADKTEICSFSRLVATGCKHSGDMRSIPNQVGTAEYIDIDMKQLQKAGARFVIFTCNAYSNGKFVT